MFLKNFYLFLLVLVTLGKPSQQTAFTSVEHQRSLPELSIPVENYKLVCEGEKEWVQCKQYELIKITKCYWGRDDHVTCPKIPTGLTTERLCETNGENTLAKVNGQCKNEQACEVVASNIFFNDNSCGNVYKYLKIWYECIPDESNVVDALRDIIDK